MIPKNQFLRSRVARRIFTLFIACALVPITVLTTLSFLEVSRELRSQSERQMQQGAKAVGLAIYERLTILDSELQVASLRIQRADRIPSATRSTHFQTLTVWKPQSDGPERSTLFSPITPSEQTHLLSGKSLVRVDSCFKNVIEQCVLMMKMIDVETPTSGLLVGEVDSTYLWSADKLPSGFDLCVFSPGQGILYGSNPDETAATIPPQRSAAGMFSWKNQETIYDAAYRDVFLEPEFLTKAWTVILSQNHEDALAPIQRFRNVLLLVTLLAIWIVILFSLIQIRRTMGPLAKLGEGTKRIAEQDFDARVEIASGDEFQDLGASFNSMSSRLGRQFHTLRAINDIDQAILSSLNRDSVVSTALSRMGNLLPSACFAIAFFEQNSSGSASVQITVRDVQSDSQRTFAKSIASCSELQSLQHNRSIQVLLGSEGAPAFLQPVEDLGMASAFVFPILLENRPFAAFVCGHSTADPMPADDVHHASQVTDQLAVAFSNVQLIEALEQLHLGTLTALARAIDAKSAWTSGHSERVTHLAMKIGVAMGLPSRELQIMQRGGLLHDVGKIGTAGQILDKPGTLEPQELQLMRDHVQIGVRILEPIAAFADALPIVAQHHEWFNGGGYPVGLAGEAISLHARIFAVADCYDAMVSDRPYRKGMPIHRVVEILKAKSGTQFDPRVIDVFVRLCAEDETIREVKDSQLAEQLT